MRWIAIALLLAACNTPSPAFRGIPAERITVGPSTFDVRQSGNRVELIRISPEPVRSLRQVAPRAEVAVEQATGCPLIRDSLRGEATLMVGRLACP